MPCELMYVVGVYGCRGLDGWPVSCSRCQSRTILRWDDGHAAGKPWCTYDL